MLSSTFLKILNIIITILTFLSTSVVSGVLLSIGFSCQQGCHSKSQARAAFSVFH